MQTTAMLSLALTLGAPALKESPAKDQDIVGEWVVESTQVVGRPAPALRETMRYEFRADGKWLVYREGQRATANMERGYTTNPKADPPTIDFILDASDQERPMRPGIYKLEGNTLTLCIGRRGKPRPTSFDVSTESPGTVYVLKRAKAKD